MEIQLSKDETMISIRSETDKPLMIYYRFKNVVVVSDRMLKDIDITFKES